MGITALLADCNPLYPDARAAAFATEAVSELLDREIPLDELLEDARKIEENVRECLSAVNRCYRLPKVLMSASPMTISQRSIWCLKCAF
ncbi:MAG: hypothetical protein Ct9H90mP16_20480 [Candidatus Poseidoniales archaeon]|nr:MAG: hypothetical protein Ct9H90mP16_20480 [Candidatus Poseidoniales archaeon]